MSKLPAFLSLVPPPSSEETGVILRPSWSPRSLLHPIARAEKPRTFGLTSILDTGLGVSAIEDLAAVAADHCDYAKLAWGSALITGNLEDKLAAYTRYDIVPLLGGTLFEYAYLRGKTYELLAWVTDRRLHLEVSDGVARIPRKEKLEWIERFARVTDVFSEVGRKVGDQEYDWPTTIAEEFSAGAAKVVIEGREIGPVNGPLRDDVLEQILESADPQKLIFEALERPQQVMLIKRVGPNVNLGNVRPADLLTVESFRRGLKEHTLLHML